MTADSWISTSRDARRAAGSSARLRNLIASAIAALVLLALAWGVIDHPPLYDELFHVLAARGLLNSGQPVIADGIYDRGQLFTQAVAASFRLFGDELVSARLPAFLCSLALVIFATLWVSAKSNWFAGLLTGVTLASSVTTVKMAVFARFYSAQALLIFVALLALYESCASSRSSRTRALCLLVATVSLAIALSLQLTTLIAIVGLACATAALLTAIHGEWLDRSFRQHPWLWLSAAVAALTMITALGWHLGFIRRLAFAPLWAEWTRSVPHFYLVEIGEELPLLWPLLGIAVLFALFKHSRITLFLSTFFVVVLAIHSIAAQKDLRYIYYAWAPMCALWGLGLATAWRLMSRSIVKRSGLRPEIAAGAITSAFLFAVISSHEGQRAIDGLLGDTTAYNAYARDPVWDDAIPAVAPLMERADRVIVSSSMKAIYFLGDYDYELNASVVGETDTRSDFGMDRRTGRSAIGGAGAVAQILNDNQRVLILLENKRVGTRAGVTRDAMRLITSRCEGLSLPLEADLSGWFCVNPALSMIDDKTPPSG